MIDPIQAVQKHIYDTLLGDSGVSAIVGTSVYDVVPDDAPAPYIALGDFTAVDSSTKSEHLEELTWTIHGFTEGESKLAGIQLNAAVKEALHENDGVDIGSPTSHRIVSCQWEYSDVLTDPDNRSFHSVARFRVVVEQA